MPPIPEVIETASKNRWPVGSVTANPPSLETAFGHLMEEHIKKLKQKQEEAA
jgi:hypothetical protein